MAGADHDASRSKRQRLADELRLQRDLAGLTGRELARRIGISQSKVSRIESGTTLPSRPEVTAWGGATGASDEVLELLTVLAAAARTEVDTWREALQGRSHTQDEIGRREADAHALRCYEPAVMPGLLQTAGYARAVLTLFKGHAPETDVSTAVAGRLNRQQILYDEDRTFEFLITEGALRWRPCPPRLLAAQLARIASVSTLDNVSIGVIPADVKATTAVSLGFTIFEGRDGDVAPYVMVEVPHARLTIRSSDDVAIYERGWSLLRQMARFGDDAREFLDRLGTDIQTLKD